MLLEKLPQEKVVTAAEMRGVAGVYCFRLLGDNRRYFGRSKNIGARFITHCSVAQRLGGEHPLATVFTRALATNGASAFSFTLVEECDAKTAKRIERELIEEFQTFQAEFGFNTMRHVAPRVPPLPKLDLRTFAEKLKAARERKRLTQGECATFLGVTIRTVNAWENYADVPMLTQAGALLKLKGAKPVASKN